MSPRSVLLACLASSTIIASVACSGGDDTPSTPADAGSSSGSSGATDDAGDGAVAKPEEAIDSGSGTTWTDLYRDLFGPTGQASCAGDGLCHGSASQAGARGSNGFVCADKDACYASMTAASPGLVTSTDTTDPTKSVLYLTLRHRRTDGSVTGSMPKRPFSYVFSTASMARIATWIQSGAKND